MGMVMPMVNVAHGLPSRIFTTAKPIAEIAGHGEKDGDGCGDSDDGTKLVAGELGQRATTMPHAEDKMTKSCTAPPRVTPIKIHKSPGRKPNCAASTGPISGPAPVMAAK